MNRLPTVTLLWIGIRKWSNVWLLGGGSGHGFKHGPALGEMMAELILKKREPGKAWPLSRFTSVAEG
jgi:glycine/D-amino acid oxidase-like deaminating enzyme